jgi:hypothetical protein
MQILDIVLRLLTLGVSASAIVVAWMGLQTWRRQLYGQYEFDLARRMLIAVYKLRNDLRHFRLGISKENFNEFHQIYAGISAEVDSCAVEAEVVWGPHVALAVRKLFECGTLFWFTAKQQFRREETLDGRPLAEGQVPGYIKADQIIYGPDDDEFGKKITTAVVAIEDIVKRHLPPKRVLNSRSPN